MSTTRTPRATSPAPILLRAAITADEWAALRKIAIDRKLPTQVLVAAALRGCYPLTPDAEPSVRPAHQEGNPPA